MGSDLSNDHINHLLSYCQDLAYSLRIAQF